MPTSGQFKIIQFDPAKAHRAKSHIQVTASSQMPHLLQSLQKARCAYGQAEPGKTGKQQRIVSCHFPSSRVKGLSFKLINSTNVNHTIIWVENIAKFVSAQGKSENKCEHS